jgi:cytochrome c biogenesis protein CcdA|tara:strand:- start:410 stop:1123 length:714 start_codon:yes stop_codon:yes gene_type:complete
MVLPEGITLPLIIGAALIDSINPCVFGVLIFLIAFMTRVFKSAKNMLLGGMIYTSVVYLTYLLLGIGFLKITVSFNVSVAVYWIAALIAIIAGLIEIKDFFWYGKGFSLQMIPGAAKRIKFYTKKIEKIHNKNKYLSYLAAGILGIFVVLVELPCTGAPYLAILAILAKGELSQGIPLLLLYNLIFVLPLFFIIAIAYFGKSSKTLENWRKKNRGLMRLITGIFLIVLGIFMLYYIM